MQRFEIKKMCLAVGSAMSFAIAMPAMAANPTANVTGNLDGFVAGSTAYEPSLRAWVRSICAVPVEQYVGMTVSQTGAAIYPTSPSNQGQFILRCSQLTAPIGSSTALTLRKSSGDSGEGLTAAAGFYPVNWIDTSSAQAVAGFSCNTAVTASEAGLADLNTQTCTYSSTTGSAYITATTGLAGLSDVEPNILNNAIGSVIPNVSSSVFTTDSVFGAIWGVPVTKTLRNRLQAVQGLAVGDDSEAQMPSLSRTALYSIFTNLLPNIDALTDANNNGIAANSFTGSNAVTVGASANGNRLYFLRRPDSSGTMASFKAMFGNTPCTGTQPWAADGALISACPALTPTTVLNGKSNLTFQSTGNLLGCMATLENNARHGIGIAATANSPFNTVVDRGFRYIKIDGVAPTLENAATGRYPYITEGVIQIPATGALVPSGDGVALYAALRAGLRSPLVVSKINSDNTGADHTYGGFQAGFVVAAAPAASPAILPTYPLNAANMRTNPVISGTRNTANANSCQPMLYFNGGNFPINK
jgi:hypothetical protein